MSSPNYVIDPRISDHLDNLSIPCHLKGYGYIPEAVQLLMDNLAAYYAGKFSITRDIYGSVAKKFNVKPSSVERALRTCVEKAFEESDLSILHTYFGNSIRADTGTVTVSQFLVTLANRILQSS